MIKFEKVSKSYGDNLVLKEIDLVCNDGEITVFIGPSGCGKTTTMKLINKLISPTTGKVLIDGKDISGINPVQLRRGIGYVIQNIGLFPHMTIARNVSVILRLLKWEKEDIDRRVDELLTMVGLDPAIFRNRYPSELSGGQQQRIGVIRALAAEPSIILMYEPFSALDPISREQLQEELNRLQKEIKKTIIFVTHDMDEALKIADKIVLMKDGHIVQEGTPEEILRHPANDFVKTFIGEKRLNQVKDIPKVDEVMIKRPEDIYPTRGLAVALKRMESKQVDSLIVVDDENHLLGYISIFDVLNAFENEDATVANIMQTFKIVIKPDTLLSEALHIVNESDTSYLPVVNEENKLVGLLTRGSIVGHMRNVYGAAGDEMPVKKHA